MNDLNYANIEAIHNNGSLKNPMEWLNMHVTSKPAYIEQFMPAEPGSYVLISGRTGIGKSMLALHMAFCLATGTPFYGLKCEKVKVGYVAMEGGIFNIKDRLNKIIPQYPEIAMDNLGFALKEPMLLPKRIDELKRLFEGCQVVIMDNLRQLTAGRYLENNYAADWLKVYQQLLADIGAVGVLTHHIKKPNANLIIDAGDVYDLKGATEYVDASDGVLLLERKRQGREKGRYAPVNPNLLCLHFAKSRIATIDLLPITLERNFEKACFDVIDNPNY